MSQAINLNFPGYSPSDGSCLPCSGVTGRAVSVSPCSSRSDSKRISQAKIASLKFRSTSSVCNASSGSYRRTPDFSRQNKNGSYRRNKQFEDGSDNLEESEICSSKNGPLNSATGTQRFQATATPGPREREIVELFRKVQAQLRERAAIKEEKKKQNPQGQTKQNETVDSLLKLLRKHSVQQGKRSSGTGNNRDFILNQPEPNGSAFFGPNSTVKNKVQESEAVPVSRPISTFRRRSPVPQIKKQPIYPDEDTINSISLSNLEGKRKDTEPEPEHEPQLKYKAEPEPEPKPEHEAEVEPIFPSAGLFDEMSGDETSEADEANGDDDVDEQIIGEHRDISGMKLTELRALAKSRGLKGLSKLKKRELMDLLTEASM